MKKLLFTILILGMYITSGLAQDHILVTEFVVTPTAGEFIEIYNPTADSIDLSNYYLSDAVYNNDNDYINVVSGSFTVGSSSDFMVKFPNGTKIGPDQHITIAFSGTGFLAEYGVAANFEIKVDDAGVVDMEPISVGGSAGLSNSGEVVILFYWNGQSDLVQDVDILVWGDQAEAVDKTGVTIDGPDADTDVSTYVNDTAIADQFVVNTDNDGDGNPHDDGMSAQRILNVEDIENWLNGNGITGHDETGENTSWMGGIWSINEVATPNARALGDSMNIADLNFVRADSIGTNPNDNSPMLGDTVTVTGIVLQGMRDIYLGARWGGFVQDERGGPWSGFFIIQNDTNITGTNLTIAEIGDRIKMRGVVSEYPTAANFSSITQFILVTDPVIPVEFMAYGLPLPDPVVLKPGDIGANGNTADPMLSERWESILVRFEGLTVTGNGLPGNTMNAGDGTGTIVLDDYFNAIYTPVNDNSGVWPGFPVGTKINVTGFLRGGTSSGLITINPRNFDDIEVSASPPEIKNISRNPAVANSGGNVEVSAVMLAPQSNVAIADLFYRVDEGAFQKVAMTNTDSLYTGVIPAQNDGAFVEYYLLSANVTGDSSFAPGDPSTIMFFYFVRDGGLKISDIQFAPYSGSDVSSFDNLEVTVQGIATTDTMDFAFYWIQDGTDPWSGLWIMDTQNNIKLGDEVSVTGTVEEDYNVTRIANVTNVTVLSSGNPVPDPLVLATGDITTGGDLAEQYESMLVRVSNIKVVTEFPDGANYGEFTVDDGTGEIRVDDMGNFRGQLDTAFVAGDSLISLTGILYYAFYNFKIEPRNDNDIVRFITDVEENQQVPLTFDLGQNYPNPFNPETTIEFQLAKKGFVTIAVYNMLGQKIKTLVDDVRSAGKYTLLWNGTDDYGIKVSSGIYFYKMKSVEFTKTQKMLLLK